MDFGAGELQRLRSLQYVLSLGPKGGRTVDRNARFLVVNLDCAIDPPQAHIVGGSRDPLCWHRFDRCPGLVSQPTHNPTRKEVAVACVESQMAPDKGLPAVGVNVRVGGRPSDDRVGSANVETT